MPLVSDDVARSPSWRPAVTLRRTIVSLAVLISVLASVVLVAVVHAVDVRTTSTAIDRALLARADDLVSLADQTSTGRTLVVPDERLYPGSAVYDAGGALVAGHADSALSTTFAELSGVSSTRSVERSGYRLLAVPVSTPSGASGVVVVSEPLGAYSAAESRAVERVPAAHTSVDLDRGHGSGVLLDGVSRRLDGGHWLPIELVFAHSPAVSMSVSIGPLGADAREREAEARASQDVVAPRTERLAARTAAHVA